MPSINERRLAVIARVTQQWEAEHLADFPDPVLDASPEAEAELQARIAAALTAAGLPLHVTPASHDTPD